MFLSGTSAYLQRMRGKSPAELSRFLLTRGLWLVVVELTIVRLLAFSSIGVSSPFILQVIFAIGVSMICLAALSRLPVAITGAVGVAMIAVHNVADGRIASALWKGPGTNIPGGDKLVTLLHQQGAFPIAGWPSPVVYVLYPLVPWVGVMMAGWAFGTLYRLDTEQRRRILIRLGLLLIACFVALRAANVYGDPGVWQIHHPRGFVYSILSFLNTQKYPPSLLYLLMTLGPMITGLGLLEQRNGELSSQRGRVARWLIVFGRGNESGAASSPRELRLALEQCGTRAALADWVRFALTAHGRIRATEGIAP